MEILGAIILTGSFISLCKLVKLFWNWVMKQASKEMLNPKHRQNGKAKH